MNMRCLPIVSCGRKQFGYPPFASMIRLIIRGVDEAQTMAFAGGLAKACKQSLGARAESVRILGPAPAPIAKLREIDFECTSLNGN